LLYFVPKESALKNPAGGGVFSWLDVRRFFYQSVLSIPLRIRLLPPKKVAIK